VASAILCVARAMSASKNFANRNRWEPSRPSYPDLLFVQRNLAIDQTVNDALSNLIGSIHVLFVSSP
jgi:hypothetical protein